MPVRGKGWYKRPYRLSYEYNGRVINKAFHWYGPFENEIDWLKQNNIPNKSWTEPLDR
jgi:hypothetical protein